MMTVGPDINSFSGGAVVTSGTGTVILGPFALMRYPSKTLTLINRGTVTLSGAAIQVNPDLAGSPADAPINATGGVGSPPDAALWYTIDDTTFRNLASGGVKAAILTGAYRWWRVVGTNSLPPDCAVSGILHVATL